MTNSADPDQKPTDLNLHCLLRQGISYSAREGLRVTVVSQELTQIYHEILHTIPAYNSLYASCAYMESFTNQLPVIDIEALRLKNHKYTFCFLARF